MTRAERVTACQGGDQGTTREEDSAGRGAALAGEGTTSCSRRRSAGSYSLFVQDFCIGLSMESHSIWKGERGTETWKGEQSSSQSSFMFD